MKLTRDELIRMKKQIEKYGITWPHHRATKAELWNWIDQHGQLINAITRPPAIYKPPYKEEEPWTTPPEESAVAELATETGKLSAADAEEKGTSTKM